MKVIDNFEAFPKSTNTLPFDKQFRSYDHCKLGCCWKSVLDRLSYGAESGSMHRMKVIDNFEAFPESTNTPPFDQQFRSYDHCKLGCCWKSVLDRLSYLDTSRL
jgi:hypothetical protein